MPQDKTKLYMIIGAVALILVLLVMIASVSCGNKGGGGKKQGPVTLTIWNIGDEKQSFDELIKDFQAEHRTVKVVYEKKDKNEYLNELTNQIAAGKGPDIVAMQNDWLPLYHDKLQPMPEGKIANRSAKKDDLEVYRDTFFDSISQDNIIENKIYGMPMAMETLSLFFNRDLMQQAMIEYSKKYPEDQLKLRNSFTFGPRNWDELVALNKFITKRNGDNIEQSGIALGTADNVANSVDILTLMMIQNGAVMTSDDLTTAQFHTQQNEFGGPEYPGTKAVDFYTSFANTGSENYSWNSSMPDSLRAFAEGKALMMIGYKNQQDEIKRINPSIQFDLKPVPQIRETSSRVNYAKYYTFSVTNSSQNMDLAWDFIVTSATVKSSFYTSATLKSSTLKRSMETNLDDPNSQKQTTKSWYKPDPDKSDELFKEMIRQVNSGKNSQTAIENTASQISSLLVKIQQ